MPTLAKTMARFKTFSPIDMHTDLRSDCFEEGRNDMCSGELIGHFNTKGDGDYSASDRDHSTRDPVDWPTRIQVKDMG